MPKFNSKEIPFYNITFLTVANLIWWFLLQKDKIPFVLWEKKTLKKLIKILKVCL